MPRVSLRTAKLGLYHSCNRIRTPPSCCTNFNVELIGSAAVVWPSIETLPSTADHREKPGVGPLSPSVRRKLSRRLLLFDCYTVGLALLMPESWPTKLPMDLIMSDLCTADLPQQAARLSLLIKGW